MKGRQGARGIMSVGVSGFRWHRTGRSSSSFVGSTFRSRSPIDVDTGFSDRDRSMLRALESF